MKSLYDSQTFMTDLQNAVDAVQGLEKLRDSHVMITGAAGLIGSYVTDILLYANQKKKMNIHILALDRSFQRMQERFAPVKTDLLEYMEHDVSEPADFDVPVDYIIHAASNAYPAAFQSDPVGTILGNIMGVKYLLDYGVTHASKRLLFISSGEVYGQGDLRLDAFEESYGGYVNPTSVRSCYPNGKRAAETLCVSFTAQYGLETVIARPSHTYGPNATAMDNRANVQFVNSAMAGEDIVLSSAGSQLRSYTYIADTASALLSIMLQGQNCEAYNIATPQGRATIAEFAKTVGAVTGAKVIFNIPQTPGNGNTTPIMKQVLSSDKIESLGWRGSYTVEQGIQHMIAVLRELKNECD